MPNIFELNINLNTTGKSEAEKALDKTTNGSAAETSDDDKGTTIPKISSKQAAAIGAIGITAARQISNEIISMQINRVGSIYGDKARQNEINNIMNGAGMLSNIASSTASGAAVGGPWGAVAGAVVGILSETVQMVERNFEYKIEQYDYKLNSGYSKERLGILTASKGR